MQEQHGDAMAAAAATADTPTEELVQRESNDVNKDVTNEVPPLMRLNWRGGLPLLVEGVPSEYEDAPLPYYTFASRQSFLPHALAAAIGQLKNASVVPSSLQRVWFSAGGVVLKWQLPLGALFDALVGDQNDDSRSRDSESDAPNERILPFRIVVHLTPPGNPRAARRVLACPGVNEIQKDFLHWFKQGMYLRYASRLPFAEFRDDDDEVLWGGVAGGSVDEFWGVLRRMDAFESKALPVRLLAKSSTLLPAVVAQDCNDDDTEIRDLVYHQHSIPIPEASMTVRELLENHLARGHVLADETDTARFIDALQDPTSWPSKNSSALRVISQGIAVPLDAPLHVLYERLAAPDFFLYICVL